MSEQADFFDGDDEPLYNIGAVSRMTDVAETTLRVWERRYDFPNSSRTDGGHRLYSHNEVMRLQWVKSRLDEGIQVSQAIKALHHLEKEGQLADTPTAEKVSSSADAKEFTAFYERLLDALLDHDTLLCDRIIAEALTVYSLEYLILNIISPIMNEVGTRWENGLVDIATEHAITNYLRHRLLQWIRSGPPAYKVQPIILTCAPEELHEGSLLMFAVLLSRLRWPISYLGQSIALDGFDVYIDQIDPSLIVFVAMTAKSAQELSKWPHVLPELYKSNHPLVCYGGRIFNEKPEYIDKVEGIFLGNSIEDGIETINQLLLEIYPSVR